MTEVVTIEARITRLKRGTRNADVLALCDEVERLTGELAKERKALAEARKKGGNKTDNPHYWRDYMREYRKKNGVAKKKGKRA